jgi:hypothetical protein
MMLDMMLMSTASGDDGRANATLGGMAAGGLLGGGAGFYALKPLEVMKNVQAEKGAVKAYKDFAEETEAISILNKIHKGQMSWDDVPESMRSMLQNSYEASKDFFDAPADVAARLKERGPAPVVHMPHTPSFLSQNVLPDRQMYAELGEHLKRPLVKRTALAGALGGGLIGKMIYDNKQEAVQAQLEEEEKVKREEEIKKVINDFLTSQK